MEYKIIEGGGITSPRGYTAGAVYVGVKSRNSQKPDVAVVYSQQEAASAAVFTTNKFCAAPVLLDREILKSGRARAIVINSGNANAATGEQGMQDALATEREAERLLGVGENQVFVCSTGVIGQKLPVEKVLEGVRRIIPDGLDAANGSEAAYAIMTTDTVRKESAYELELSGGTIRIGAMAKGSGMIHPNMATTLAFVTTDARCDAPTLQKMLSAAIDKSFNMCTVDGDTSTNDTMILLANGASGVEGKTEEDKAALAALLHDSAKEISKDEMRAIMRAHPELAEGGEERPTPVWHGICAAILARTEWGVEDEAVLSAIACHTAGKPGMSRLDKIVYLADMSSKERDWPGVNKLRKLELKDLDLAMLAALRQTNDFVLSQGKPLDPMSKAAYDEIKAEVDARAAKAG